MVDAQVFKALLKGLLTFVPGATRILDKKKEKSRHSGSQAEFCYALWLSMLRQFEENGIQPKLDFVGEIGTGGSLGVGICALLTGSQRYCALEIGQSFDKKLNLNILDDLILLFQNRSKIPDNFQQLNIKAKNLDFPDHLIEPTFLNNDLIAEIRNDIENGYTTQKRISIVKNWESQPSLNLDFIFSRAVMEHVTDPAAVYSAAAKHLSLDSFMLHDIEFHSHGLTIKIDGHYQIHPFLWKIIVGKRPFFLNRWQLPDHLNAMKRNGFEITETKMNYFEDSIATGKVLIGASVIAKKEYE